MVFTGLAADTYSISVSTPEGMVGSGSSTLLAGDARTANVSVAYAGSLTVTASKSGSTITHADVSISGPATSSCNTGTGASCTMIQ